MATTPLLPTSSSVPRETIAPVLTREPLGLSHLSLNDRIQTDVVKGWLWNTSQSRLQLELEGRSVSVVMRELTPSEFREGDREPSLRYFTTLFWKAMKIQYCDDAGALRSKWILVNRNSYNKRISEIGVSLDSIQRLDLTPENVRRKAEKATLSLGLKPEHNVHDLLMRFYERELEYRLTDVTLTEGQITLYSRGGRFFIYFLGKPFDLDKEIHDFTFTSDGRSTASNPWRTEINLTRIHEYLNANYNKWDKIYREGGFPLPSSAFSREGYMGYVRPGTPFRLSKEATGLPRTLFFYSPSQIYLLENREEDELIAFGGYKKVKPAINLLSGKEMVLSSMSTSNRVFYDKKTRGNVRVKGDDIEDLKHELEVRSPLIGAPHVIQTVASHTFRSSKGEDKVWIIENRYDSDLFSAIHIDPRTRRSAIELTAQEKLSVARQIIMGLRTIHEAGLVHRDIKPENILIRCQKKGGRRVVSAVVSDLGLAVKNADRDGCSLFAGTSGYLAPEYASVSCTVRGAARHDVTKDVIDWYATGLTLHALFCGSEAFLRTGSVSTPVFTSAFITKQPDLHRLILAMTSANPVDRSWIKLDPLVRAALPASS